MANIAKLAIKLVADMEKAQKDFSSMSSTIASIEKSAKTATPSMRNLTDAVKGLGMMQKAVANAQEMSAHALPEQMVETQRVVNETTASLGNMKTTVENLGRGVSDDILQMKPTLSNVQKAQGEIQKLVALQKELGDNGHLLTDSIKTVQANMANLGNAAMQTKSEMMMLKSAINGINMLPFMVLSGIFTEMVSGMKGFMSDFNERFGGMPARIAQVTAAVTALVVVLGLATAKTTALGLSTSYFMALWKSSVIYQGVSGFITLVTALAVKIWACATATAAWLAAQLGLNAAWTYFLASTGIGLILVAIAGIAAGVASLISGFASTSNKIQECADRTAAFRDRIREVIDASKTMATEQQRYLDAQMTSIEKYAAGLANINKMLNQKHVLQIQIDAVGQEASRVFAEAAKANKKDAAKLWEQYEKLLEDQVELEKLWRESLKFTEKRAKAAREEERLNYLKNQYGSLIEETMTAQERYTKTLAQLEKDFRVMDGGVKRVKWEEEELIRKNATEQWRSQLGIEKSDAAKLHERMKELDDALKAKVIKDHEYASAVQKAKEQWDPATKAAIEATKKLAQAQERAAAEFQNLVNKFKGMGKTPIESFKELSVDLRRVQDALSPAEFAAAKNKLLSDLANGLGIAQYLADAATPAQQLAQTYKNLEAYAREANLSTQQLTDAQNRAKTALEKQSEYYNLYQKAQDSMLTVQQKLNRELTRIADEAKQWGWDKSIVARMQEMKAAELLGGSGGDQESGPGSRGSQSQNRALEYGTVDYYEKQMEDKNKPLIDETKKQTKEIKDFRRDVQHLNTGTVQPMIFIA
ncbi:MAG: hypothetical protein FWE95_05270 [Planctomycetaceae bacterium]|nr:hypothetical protein [Planctomycetaceae bacterium]